jgi:lambda repressor-like predicted transcriptional regulator
MENHLKQENGKFEPFRVTSGAIDLYVKRDHDDSVKTLSMAVRTNFFNKQFLCNFLTGVSNVLQGRELTNTGKASWALKFIFFLNKKDIYNLVTQREWQSATLHFLYHVLTDTKSKASIRTRTKEYEERFATVLRELQFLNVINADFIIPSAQNRRQVSFASVAKSNNIMGISVSSNCVDNESVQKLILDVDPYAPDASYLDNLEMRLKGAISELKQKALCHFKAMKTNHLRFKDIASAVTDETITDYLKRNDLSVPFTATNNTTYQRSHIHPEQQKGIALQYALVRYQLSCCDADKDCLTREALNKVPFFRQLFINRTKYLYPSLEKTGSAFNQSVTDNMNKVDLFFNHCGCLSNIDISAMCILLMIENPKLNIGSILSAKVLSNHGKSYLITTDSDKMIFSVDKPRAGSRKYIQLSELSLEIISHILAVTQPFRSILKRCGDRAWRYLFLTRLRNSTIGFPFAKTRGAIQLSASDDRLSFASLYADHDDQYFRWDHNVNFRSIRNTMGVITWLETGSIDEMSRTLGNKRQVALEYYIPPVLLKLWNERIIRKFQHALIILACHDKPWLLEVTDFHTHKQLEEFITQLIFYSETGRSPVDDKIDALLNFDASSSEAAKHDSHGFIRFEENSLAALYAFQDVINNHRPEHHSDLTQKLLQLAKLMRHACGNPDTRRKIFDLPDNQIEAIQAKALDLIPKWSQRFADVSIAEKWEDECQAN